MTVRRDKGRPKRPWIIDIHFKTKSGGRKRYRRDAQLQTGTGARAEERRLLMQVAERGEIVTEQESSSASAARFDDAVDYYRATYAKVALQHSTRSGYDEIFDRLLLGRFGARRLDEARWYDDVALLDAELREAGDSESSRRNVQVALRSVLRHAVESGKLEEMPKLPPLPKVHRVVMVAMERRHVDAILEAGSDSARGAFAIAAFAGLRGSEVRALRLADVTLDGTSPCITVRRAISRGVEGRPKWGSQRVIPIAGPLRPYLEAAHRGRGDPMSFVATTHRGESWAECGFSQAFARAQKRAGLRGWSFHSLRHFFATELFRRGASAPVVQQLLGHETLSTTAIYANMGATDCERAIALLDGNGAEMSAPAPDPGR